MIASIPDYVVPVIVAIASGGLFGGIALYIKARPEAGKITVDAAAGAVIVQSGVIKDLRDENDRLQGRISALEAEMTRFSEIHVRITHLEEENRRLHRENEQLRKRIAHLEREANGG